MDRDRKQRRKLSDRLKRVLKPASKVRQSAERLITKRDINPLRYDVRQPDEDDELRDTRPTLPDSDPLRYDVPC